MSELFEDLRFFIGSFFFLVGALLLIQSVVSPSEVEGMNVNLDAGIGFVIFAFCAFALTWRSWNERRRLGKGN